MNPWYTLEGSDEETSEVPSDAENALALRSGAAPGNVSAPAVSEPSRPSKPPAASQGQKRPAVPWTLWCKALFIVPHISVWGSSFFGCHPARPPVLPPPSFSPPSVLLLHTHLTSFPNTQSSHHLTHTHTHLVISHLTFTHTVTHTTQLSHQLTHTHTLSLSSHHLTHTHFFSSHISTHNFIYSPFLSHLTSAVAGAVSRDCRRGCGARCRRWGPGSLRSGRRRRGCGARCRRWGLGSLRSGRRSLQRLQKGLRRALSPLGAPASRIVSAAGRMFEKPVSAPLPLCFAKQGFSLYAKRSVNAAPWAFVKPVSALLPL